MSVHVHTARIGTPGLVDSLDVTRASARGDGLAFAPSWAILRPVLDARKVAEVQRREGADAAAAAWEQAAWERYVPAFVAEMRASYRDLRPAWERLLDRRTVTLLCYCDAAAHCHRTLLARAILPKLGAVYVGEVARSGGL